MGQSLQRPGLKALRLGCAAQPSMHSATVPGGGDEPVHLLQGGTGVL